MNKQSRLATGNKVEVIDDDSINFGRRGELVGPILVEMIDGSAKPEYRWKVKLEDTGTVGTFAPDKLRKIQ